MKGSGKVKMSSIRGSATLPTKSLQVEDGKTQKSEKQVRIGLLGASGYTGAEVCSTWVWVCMEIGMINCLFGCKYEWLLLLCKDLAEITEYETLTFSYCFCYVNTSHPSVSSKDKNGLPLCIHDIILFV